MITKDNNTIYITVEDAEGFEYEVDFTTNEILDEFSDEELVKRLTNRGSINSLTFNKEQLKKLLYDIAEANYHAPIDDIFNKIKSLL